LNTTGYSWNSGKTYCEIPECSFIIKINKIIYKRRKERYDEEG